MPFNEGRQPSILFVSALVILLALLCGCTLNSGPRLVTVEASAETTPVPHNDDAADDPAIWVNEASPGDSLILGTDKQGGLQVFDLDGNQLEYLAVGKLNNVDLRSNPYYDGSTIVVSSQREPARLIMLLIEHESATVQFKSSYEVELPEPYGICATVLKGKYYAILNDKNGTFHQYEITSTYELKLVRTWATKTQPEGCVVDDETHTIYVGEEEVGIWRMSSKPQDSTEFVIVAKVGEHRLKADIEGLTLYQSQSKSYLVASSQGNNSYAVFDTSDHSYRGSFKVGESRRIDGTSDTDGIAATALPTLGMEDGFLVVQDGMNTKPNANQNFKIISWSDIQRKLSLTGASSTNEYDSPN